MDNQDWTDGTITFQDGSTPHLFSDWYGLSGDMADLYHKGDDGQIYIKENAAENGKRLAECWNACVDIPNPKPIQSLIDAIVELHKSELFNHYMHDSNDVCDTKTRVKVALESLYGKSNAI